MYISRYISRNYENIYEIDFENPENKEIVSVEYFCIKLLQDMQGVKYFFNDMLIGAIDSVSHKHQIKCKESYKEVFDFISNILIELGW